MTDRERALVEQFDGSPIARLFGMSLSYPEAGVARVDLPYNPNLDHPLHGIHGGIIATLADIAGWYASAVRHGDQIVATVEYRVHLLEPVAGKAMWGEGRVLRAGRRIDVCEMKVFDEAGRTVAAATGTFVPQRAGPAGVARANER